MDRKTSKTKQMNALAANSLTNKTAIVTGASTGIGRAIALALATAGAQVIVHARARQREANDVADEIRQLGSRADVMLADLADPQQQTELVERAWSWQNGVDIWINNAGVDVLTGEMADSSFANKLQRLWQVDVAATMAVSRDVGKRMKARGHGTILNMGWDRTACGMTGDSGQMFAAIRGAVTAFTLSLARSLAPEVRVNCLAPGWIRTAWGETASEYWQERATAESLMQRWGTPEDIARVARFLVSAEADFVNGQVIAINGGFAGEYPGDQHDEAVV
jgi:3-oxoacyl-[acyl-carrier protein] reductase